MSDEARKRPVKRAWRLLLFCLLCALVVAVVVLFVLRDHINLDAARRFVSYLNVSSSGSYGEYTYDFGASNAFCAFDDGLAVVSQSGVTTYSEKGTQRLVENVALTTPAVQAEGKYLLAYDAGGTELRVLHAGRGTVAQITASEVLLDADLAPDGSVCYIDRQDGYKTVLSVLDNDQNLIYRWNSASRYFNCCTLNKGAELLAATALGVTDGVYESTLLIFDTDSEEPRSETVLGEDVILDVEFCGDTICALGQQAVYFVSKNGEIKGIYDASAYNIQDFAFGGDGFIALYANMYQVGELGHVITLDLRGNEIANLEAGQVESLSASGKYLAVLVGDTVTVYTEDLDPYAQTQQTGIAERVLMRDDGTVLLLQATTAHLYIP